MRVRRKREDAVTEQLTELRQDVHDLWVALTTDPKKLARRERAWGMIESLISVGATFAARKVATRVWAVLTGEIPPPAQAAEEQAAEVRREGAV